MSYTPGDFDSPHVYVQWGGKLPGNEQWSCGFRMRKKTGTATIADGAGLLTGVAAAISAFHTRAGSKINQYAKLSFVKCNTIAVNGHYADSTGGNEAFFADLAGNVVDLPRHPNQVAIAVSLMTGFSRGPAHRGRFYVPLPALGIGADGLIDPTDATALSGSVDTLITAVNAVSTDFEMAVFSRKAGAAGNRKVTDNLIGRALDTQRRRRRSLVEDYR